MPEPFPYYEDWCFDVEAKEVVFKRGSMLFTHEEPDESFVFFCELFAFNTETDSGGVYYAEVVCVYGV